MILGLRTNEQDGPPKLAHNHGELLDEEQQQQESFIWYVDKVQMAATGLCCFSVSLIPIRAPSGKMIFCVYIIYIFLYVWLVADKKVCSQVMSVLVERYVPLARAKLLGVGLGSLSDFVF